MTMLGVTRLVGWHDRIAYHLDFWLYGATPTLLYLAGLALCALVWVGVRWAPEGLAGLLLVLALVGIRNAWDLVTAIAPLVGSNAAQGPPPPAS